MSNGLHPCSISSKESENTLVPPCGHFDRAARKTSDEATKSLCRTAAEATHHATSNRRGDAEDLRAGSITESTLTRSYPRRITDGSLAGHQNPDPDAPQNTASRGLVSPIPRHAPTSPRTSSMHPGLGRLGHFLDRCFGSGGQSLTAPWTLGSRGLRPLEALGQQIELLAGGPGPKVENAVFHGFAWL